MEQRTETGSTKHLSVVEQKSPADLMPARPPSLLPSHEAWQQMTAMAVAAYKSGLMPDGVRNQEAALVTALKGYELGVPFMAAIEGIHIIKGKATVGAHLMLALIKRTYGGQAIRVAETDIKHCTMEYREPGWDQISRFTFTMEDAQRAGLVGGDNWKKYPAAMLRARAISAAGKLAFPEVVGGLYVAGELGDAAMVTEDGDVVPDLRAASATVVDDSKPAAPAPAPRTPRPEVQDAEYRDVAQPAAASAQEPEAASEIADFTAFWSKWRPNKVSNLEQIKGIIGRDPAGIAPAELDRLVTEAVAAGKGPKAAQQRSAPPSAPAPARNGTRRDVPMTEEQNRKLHAEAGERFGREGHEIVHALAVMQFGIESVADLTKQQASQLIQHLIDADPDTVRGFVADQVRQQAIDRGQAELPAVPAGADIAF